MDPATQSPFLFISYKDGSLINLDETLATHWFIPEEPGQYMVRLAGHSKLGWFIRQKCDLEYNAADIDGNGLLEYWENRYPSHPPGSDNDIDGLTALEEYRNGTFPDNEDSDSGGAKDGQEVEDGANPLILLWDS